LEGVASVILAVGLVSAYFLGGNLTGTSESKSQDAISQSTSKKVTDTGKKTKKKRTAAVHQSSPPVEQPRLPGGNESFTGPVEVTEPEPEDPALVAASIEAGVAAQEHRAKAKKTKKKVKSSATKPADATPAASASTAKSAKSKRSGAQIAAPDADGEGESEWRVVGRKSRANTTADSAASYTTTSATEPGSPKEENPPAQSLESSEIQNPRDVTSSTDDLREDVDNAPPSLLNSREFGALSSDAAAESTEDDGFVAVTKGRRRTQRTASASSIGGGGGSSVRSSESLTKKQRQNQAKREAQKAAKAAEQREQAKALGAHRKGLEKARIEELHKQGKQLSGGMSMSVGNSGKAEWD